MTGEVVGEGPLTEGRTAEENIAALRRLHSSAAPDQIARWQSMVGPDLGARLGSLVTEPWVTGPYGEPARVAIADRLADVRAWTDRCAELAAMVVDRPWVPTHGETHTSNQVRTAEGIVFVDWESLKLAPRERDLSTLVQAGYGDRLHADVAMVELFDLEWRLSEIDSYAAWFASPHTGTTDDRVAYEGLRSELHRDRWWRA